MFHIEEKADIAKIVILSGDPKRVEFQASSLINVKLVSDIRSAKYYTGFNEKGTKITIGTHGMGMPSASIYSHELFRNFDVDQIIRIGSCGSYDKNYTIGNILELEETSIRRYDNNRNTIKVDPLNSGFPLVKNYCSNHIYEGNSGFEKPMSEVNVVSMESYAIKKAAIIYGKKASSLLVVSDELFGNWGVMNDVDKENGTSIKEAYKWVLNNF
ncbi:MAG: hypothetical protein K4H23_03170 [Mollicutes bacterium PWAP]|nr:hypothetical protein [Mollicutes bacterium PWAP]